MQLEIRIRTITGVRAENVHVRMSLRTPGGVTPPVDFDTVLPHEKLSPTAQAPEAYGRTLGDVVFGTREAAALLERALSYGSQARIPLRLLLIMDPGSPAAALHWETLAAPGSEPLSFKPDVFITRFVEVQSPPAPLGPPSAYPSALIVVVSPEDLSPIFRAVHIKRAQDGLKGVSKTVLPEPVTLASLQAGLRNRPDILYLVSHGTSDDQGARLWFEDFDGSPHGVALSEFLKIFSGHRPRLVILGSCYGAGNSGVPGEFVGPLLARAEVPAVLAFDGLLSVRTLDSFVREFFRELHKSGRLEHAVATARSSVRLPGWEWAQPVLFSRYIDEELLLPLRDAPSPTEFPQWRTLVQAIENRNCIPVVGWDSDLDVVVPEPVLAQSLAKRFGLPVLAEDTQRFWEVARIVVTMQSRDVVLNEVERELSRKIRRDLGLGKSDSPDSDLVELVLRASRSQREAHPDHPLRAIAEIPSDTFFTTSWFPTLADALRVAGKTPVSYVPGWNERMAQDDLEEQPEPSVDRPWVVHLAGLWSDPDSIVLTDDDHGLLATAISTPKIFPDSIPGEAGNRRLLVYGTDVSDPILRILLQAFTRWTPYPKRNPPRHVMVYPEPTHDDEDARGRARNYIDVYLKNFAATLCWEVGSEFARKLRLERERQDAE